MYLEKLKLTDRENQCLYYLLRGKSNREIGAALNLSKRTVEDHMNKLKEKMNCTTRSEILEICIQQKIIYDVSVDTG